jgi:hypothetical protein
LGSRYAALETLQDHTGTHPPNLGQMVAGMNTDAIGYWILNDNAEPVPANVIQWSLWFTDRKNIIAQTVVQDFKVSTVFNGLACRFETAVFKLSRTGKTRILRSTWLSDDIFTALEDHVAGLSFAEQCVEDARKRRRAKVKAARARKGY